MHRFVRFFCKKLGLTPLPARDSTAGAARRHTLDPDPRTLARTRHEKSDLHPQAPPLTVLVQDKSPVRHVTAGTPAGPCQAPPAHPAARRTRPSGRGPRTDGRRGTRSAGGPRVRRRAHPRPRDAHRPVLAPAQQPAHVRPDNERPPSHGVCTDARTSPGTYRAAGIGPVRARPVRYRPARLRAWHACAWLRHEPRTRACARTGPRVGPWVRGHGARAQGALCLCVAAPDGDVGCRTALGPP